MKSIKQKYNELIQKGFSKKTLYSLNEIELSGLYKLISEQVKQTTKQVTTTTIPSSVAKSTGANVGNVDIKQDASGNIVATKMEGEMKEAGKKKVNPWAVCTSTMGKKFGTTERSEWTKKQMDEYERCVMDVKKSAKKYKKKIDEELEKQLVKLVEKHISPRMTKGDLLNLIEQGTKEAPTKPKETEKERTRPWHPGRDPRPGVDPAPKAKKSDEKKKEDIMKIIAKILNNNE
jgi:hypothetical protein